MARVGSPAPRRASRLSGQERTTICSFCALLVLNPQATLAASNPAVQRPRRIAVCYRLEHHSGAGNARLDSERFRFVPRTCGPPCGRLESAGVMALGINGGTNESTRLMEWGFAMAFASYLGDFDVDAETNRVLDVALEMTRAALGLADDFANGIIARQIVELARAGERNPDLLCEGALKKLRGALFGD
jgi:hypothetical protein